jgi:DNA polymerase III alpha subunit (gram-positive type)
VQVVKQEFHTQHHPIEGLDDAAKEFFAREQKRNAVKAGELPPEEFQSNLNSSGVPKDSPEIDADGLKKAEHSEQETVGDGLVDETETAGLAPEPDNETNLEEERLEEGESDSMEVEETGGDLEIPDEALVTLPDGSQATFHELQRGFLREQDYTRKNQELAEQRKGIQEEISQANAQIEQRSQALDQLIGSLQSEMNEQQVSPMQLEKLRAENPAEYAAMYADMQRKGAKIQQAQAARHQLQTEAAQRIEAQRQARIPAERQHLEQRSPEFKKDFDSEYAKLGRYILAPDGGGLRAEEWDLVDDHRYVLLAHKAMKYDEATRKKAPSVRQKVAGLPRVVRPGVQRDPGDTHREEENAVMQRLKENPESKDAQEAAWLMREQKRSRQRRGGGAGRRT